MCFTLVAMCYCYNAFGLHRRVHGGHPVHQISEEEKQMSEEVKKAQREMARRLPFPPLGAPVALAHTPSDSGLLERLKGIDMGEFELSEYEKHVESVAQEILQLRVILGTSRHRLMHSAHPFHPSFRKRRGAREGAGVVEEQD